MKVKTKVKAGSVVWGDYFKAADSGRSCDRRRDPHCRGPDRSPHGPDPPQSQGGIAMKVKTNVKAGIVGGSN